MMLSRVRSKLAHDGVRNAVQLTVAELAAVESHPCSHPQWVLRRTGRARSSTRGFGSLFRARHGEQMQVMRVIRGQ